MSIRLLLADDHTMVRQALRDLVQKTQGITVVAEAGNGVEVLRLAKEFAPDIVVMDVNMPDMDGIQATRSLLAAQPGIKVIALSAYSDKQYIMGMLKAGAVGYVVKSEAGSVLVRAIHGVKDGLSYLCPQVSAAVADTFCAMGKAGKPILGPREREVLELLAGGFTSKEMGKRLFISRATVEVHRRNIMRKLELHSIAELTKYAISEGLVVL